MGSPTGPRSSAPFERRLLPHCKSWDAGMVSICAGAVIQTRLCLLANEVRRLCGGGRPLSGAVPAGAGGGPPTSLTQLRDVPFSQLLRKDNCRQTQNRSECIKLRRICFFHLNFLFGENCSFTCSYKKYREIPCTL